MTFSFFELLFVLAVLAVVYIVHPSLRIFALVMASILYSCKFNEVAPLTLTGCTVVCYFAGLLMGKLKGRRKAELFVLLLFVLLCVAALSIFKIFTVPIRTAGNPTAVFALEWMFMSIGFSYYIFQTISYLADIYREKVPVQKNPLLLALYLSFFPKIVSGPIERSDSFFRQAENIKKLRFWELSRYSRAAIYILYGFFMKTLLADRIAPIVTTVFAAPSAYGRGALITASLLYTLQIYLDFAGYSAVAIGVAELFGIRLSANFHSPYLSGGFTEFWRRWHMTLGSFLRDYIYIPLGGNRKGTVRKYINTLVVFLVCGIWHGGGLNFIVWGLFHGTGRVLNAISADRGWFKTVPDPVKRVVTFSLVSFAWIFFGVKDLDTGLIYIGAMITGNGGTGVKALLESLEFGAWDIGIFAVGMAMVTVFDVIAYRRDEAFCEVLQKLHYVKRLLVVYVLLMCILVFGVYGPEYDPTEFIYMRF